jgi:hypothetical protein
MGALYRTVQGYEVQPRLELLEHRHGAGCVLRDPAACGHEVAGQHDGDRCALRPSGRGGRLGAGAYKQQQLLCGGGGGEERYIRQAGSRFRRVSESQRFQPRTHRTDPSSVNVGSKSGCMCIALGVKRRLIEEGSGPRSTVLW